jgi:6-phosphogluconolactonase
LQVLPDADALARRAAELIAQAVQHTSTRFCIALSGGSTPKTLYTLLAAPEFAPQIEWPRVHVFWGDERCVPPDHPDSNYRMARETLLDYVPIPPENIHRIAGEFEPAEAAALYEQHLRSFFDGEPRFDLILLGMGNDGHTASLFPHTPALHEQERWVVANYALAQQLWRVTFTPAAINAAARVMFLVSGAEKAETLRRVLNGPSMPEELPAQLVQPVSGETTWLLDRAAASLIET